MPFHFDQKKSGNWFLSFTQVVSGHLFVVVDLFDISMLWILRLFHIVIDGACRRMKLIKKHVEFWSRLIHPGMVIVAWTDRWMESVCLISLLISLTTPGGKKSQIFSSLLLHASLLSLPHDLHRGGFWSEIASYATFYTPNLLYFPL